MHVPCTLAKGEETSPSALPLFIRVMDYDWGKKDDLCGEVVVDAKRLAKHGDAVSLPLWRKGKLGKGVITLSARLIPYVASSVVSDNMRDAVLPNHSHILLLTVWQATDLRKADWFGKNDVYIQAYFPEPEDAMEYRGRTWSDWIHTGATPKLPEPTKKTSLPPGWSSFPFFLQIPPECPGSAEFRYYYYVVVVVVVVVPLLLLRRRRPFVRFSFRQKYYPRSISVGTPLFHCVPLAESRK